jgi:hypothetical protein
MVWRRAYETREIGPVACPLLSAALISGTALVLPQACVLMGGFDLRAQAELGVWRRLIPDAITVYFLDSATSLRAMTPRSQWDSVAHAPPSEEWADFIAPDRPERSFAGVLRNGEFQILMVGMHTEEAWDRLMAIRA